MSGVTAELERRRSVAQKEMGEIKKQLGGLRGLSDSVRALMEAMEQPELPSKEELNEERAERSLLDICTEINRFMVDVNAGIKGRLGAPAVRQFMREVRNKLQTMLDGMPKPAVEAVRPKVDEIHAKLNALEVDARAAETQIDELPDASFALIEAGGEKDEGGKTTPRSLRHLPYRDAAGKVDDGLLRESMRHLPVSGLTAPQQAVAKSTLLYAARANDVPLPESHASPHADREPNAVFEHLVSLKESVYDEKKAELTVCLIESGTNPAKKRHYPEATIREAAPQFAGLKMFINHPTPAQMKERPERDVRDWGSTITESRYDGGKAVAKVAVHSPFLRELLADPVARRHIGLSINTQGITEDGQIDGQRVEVVKRIVVEKGERGRFSSVDWVTEPGARGRVLEAFSSRAKDTEMLETLALSDLKAQRPDLVETIQAEAAAAERSKVETEGKEKMEKNLQEAVKPLDERIGKLEAENKAAKQEVAIRRELDKTRLPAAHKDKIVESLAGKSFEKPEQLLEAVKGEINAAIALMRGAGFKVNDDGGTAPGDGTGSVASRIEESMTKRAGLEEQKDQNKS